MGRSVSNVEKLRSAEKLESVGDGELECDWLRELDDAVCVFDDTEPAIGCCPGYRPL